MIDSRRRLPARDGTAAHRPASSWRRNSSIRRCSSSARSTSPSAIRTSPWPGFILRKRTRGLCQNRVGSRPLLTAQNCPNVGFAGESRGCRRGRRPRRSPAAPAPPPETPARGPLWRPRAASSPWARRAASTEECVQPEPWAAPSGWRSPCELDEPPTVEEHIGRGFPVAAGDDHGSRLRARAPRARGCSMHRASPRPHLASSVRASGTFGVRTVALGSNSSMSADRAVGVEQHRPRLGHHHGIDHDRRAVRAARSSASATASIVGRSPSIPILTASTPMSSATARTWARIDLRRDRMDGGDADRVLRGDRGDRGHAVDAAGGERLQVGLDAGAGAGVRACDR